MYGACSSPTLLPGEAGSCLIEGHPVTEYADGLVPAPGVVQTYLVAGEAACGTGEVAPASGGGTRNVTCP